MVYGGTTLALALRGSPSQANAQIEDERKRFPMDTLVNARELPMTRAAIELSRGNPTQALKALQSATLYERRYPLTIYLRGLSYLSSHKAA